jgi:hypothetical protein
MVPIRMRETDYEPARDFMMILTVMRRKALPIISVHGHVFRPIQKSARKIAKAGEGLGEVTTLVFTSAVVNTLLIAFIEFA